MSDESKRSPVDTRLLGVASILLTFLSGWVVTDLRDMRATVARQERLTTQLQERLDARDRAGAQSEARLSTLVDEIRRLREALLARGVLRFR